MTKCKTCNDNKCTFFCKLNELHLTDKATASTALNNHNIYIEIEAGQNLESINMPSDLPDMCWLAPLVVKAFSLRCQMLGETGEFPLPSLINDYNSVIEYITQLLMPLPLKAMEITKEVATDSIWIDIADAVAAHYTKK